MNADEIIESFGNVDHSKEIREELRNNLKNERNYTPTSELIEDKLYALWWFVGFSIFGILGLAMFLS